MLKIFNSFSSNKEDFKPFESNLVKIFICGPTLYDYTHVGHARIFLTYDLLCRILHQEGIRTDVLVNMTDINQNVFSKAKEGSRSYKDVSTYYAKQFVTDLFGLNIKSVNRLAFVSDYVPFIEKYIDKLVQKNQAYIARGNVYLDTENMSDYGKISGQTPLQLSLHYLDIGPNKKNQKDIMLWNCSDNFDVSWDSKFGKGIPWWHIQDTAVALENFGNNYDIHGGARELVFPHHEAHLVQYALLSGSSVPVKTWMYVGLVLSRNQKMSKSLGNVTWIRDLLQKYGQNLVRLYIFSYHYRNDIEFSEDDLVSKKPILDLILITKPKTGSKTDKEIESLLDDFIYALHDDLNSPLALECVNKICNQINEGKKISTENFDMMCNILGITI
ncbi:MAG: class I tRNA ligase family protein [Nitrososphaera sp.]|jgi:cysteinyl-tRNA synthetase